MFKIFKYHDCSHGIGTKIRLLRCYIYDPNDPIDQKQKH